MSVWFSTIKELLAKYATELQGKIIVDPSNPIAPDNNGGFKKIIGAQESAGQIIAGLLAEGSKVGKSIRYLRLHSLAERSLQKTGSCSFVLRYR